jgi:hypothetical protein
VHERGSLGLVVDELHGLIEWNWALESDLDLLPHMLSDHPGGVATISGSRRTRETAGDPRWGGFGVE